MGAKSEIGWTRRDSEGRRVEVYARRTGSRWLFFSRQRRFENWQPLTEAPLEDWLALLDAAERRAARRLLMPDDLERLKAEIKARFPEAEIG